MQLAFVAYIVYLLNRADLVNACLYHSVSPAHHHADF